MYKTATILCLFLLSHSTNAQFVGTWSQQTLTPDQPVLRDIDMYDTQIGFAVGGVNANSGFSGVVFTFDGGRNWAPIPDMQFTPVPPAQLIWHAVCVVDPQTIFIAGDSAIIYKSLDGGISWTRLNKFATKPAAATLRDILFIDQMTGYVVGGDDGLSSPGSPAAPTIILRTTDGGANWTDESIPANTYQGDPSAYSIKYVPGMWMISANFATLLVNSGSGWTRLPRPSGNVNEGYYDLSLISTNEFLFSGIDWSTMKPRLYRTINGGARYLNITPANIPAGIQSFEGCNFFLADFGWVAGSQDYLMATTNAGAVWTRFSVLGNPVPGPVTGMDFTDQIGRAHV